MVERSGDIRIGRRKTESLGRKIGRLGANRDLGTVNGRSGL